MQKILVGAASIEYEYCLGRSLLLVFTWRHQNSKINLRRINSPELSLHGPLEQLQTWIHPNFHFERALRFVIQYAWISKLLRDAACTWRRRGLLCRLKSALFRGRKSFTSMFIITFRDEYTLLKQNPATDVSVGFDRYVGAYPNGHQHGVSIQSSVKLGADLNLGEGLCIFTSLHIYLLISIWFWFLMTWQWKPAIALET